MLSKPIKNNKKIIDNTTVSNVLINNVIVNKLGSDLPNLLKLKIPELKIIAKYNRLHISGTKPALIARIQDYYKKCTIAIKIQKMARGFFVRLSFKLRGDGFKDRTKCTNMTDFLTMEPLNEIPHMKFFSFTDDNNFIYGFDIDSLISLYQNKGKLINPYNRERFKTKTIIDILKLYGLSTFIYKHTVPEPPVNSVATNQLVTAPMPSTNIPAPILASLTATLAATVSGPILASLSSGISIPMPAPQINPFSGNPPRMTSFQLNEIRGRPLNTRIISVFMEMDQLGHYTNTVWFQELDKRQLFIFFKEIYAIWRFRAQLSATTKYNICRYDPIGVFQNLNYDVISFDELQEGCLKIFENMVYMGIDTDHRNLGTFHMLTALTIVSIPARNAMRWLYESIM